MKGSIINAILTAFLLGIIMMGCTAPAVESTECGMCGAHITEWWQVRDDANTCFVDVCAFCYDAVYNAE